MAIALLSSSEFQRRAEGTPYNNSHTLLAGDNRLVVVCAGWYDSDPDYIMSASYGGVSMTELYNSGAYDGGLIMWYLLEDDLPANGSQTLSIVSSPDGVMNQRVGIAVFENVAQSVSDSGGNYQSSTALTNTVSLTANNDYALWITACMFMGFNNTCYGNDNEPNTGKVQVAYGGVGSPDDVVYMGYSLGFTATTQNFGVSRDCTNPDPWWMGAAVFEPYTDDSSFHPVIIVI